MSRSSPLQLAAAGIGGAVHLRWFVTPELLFPRHGFELFRRPSRLSCWRLCLGNLPDATSPELPGFSLDDSPSAEWVSVGRGVFCAFPGLRERATVRLADGEETGLVLPEAGVTFFLPRPSLRVEARVIIRRRNTLLAYETRYCGEITGHCETVVEELGPYERMLRFGPTDTVRLWSSPDQPGPVLTELRYCVPDASEKGWDRLLKDCALDLPIRHSPNYPGGGPNCPDPFVRVVQRLGGEAKRFIGVTTVKQARRLSGRTVARKYPHFARLQETLEALYEAAPCPAPEEGAGAGVFASVAEGLLVPVPPDIFVRAGTVPGAFGEIVGPLRPADPPAAVEEVRPVVLLPELEVPHAVEPPPEEPAGHFQGLSSPELLVLTSLDPVFARLLGLYWEDHLVKAGRRYDYRVEGSWTCSAREERAWQLRPEPPFGGFEHRTFELAAPGEMADDVPGRPAGDGAPGEPAPPEHRLEVKRVSGHVVVDADGLLLKPDGATPAVVALTLTEPWWSVRLDLVADDGALVLTVGEHGGTDLQSVGPGRRRLDCWPPEMPRRQGEAVAEGPNRIRALWLGAFARVRISALDVFLTLWGRGHTAYAFDVVADDAVRWVPTGRASADPIPWLLRTPASAPQLPEGRRPVEKRAAVRLRWGVPWLLQCAPEDGVPLARPARYHVVRLDAGGKGTSVTGDHPLLIAGRWPRRFGPRGARPWDEEELPAWFTLDAGSDHFGLPVGGEVEYAVWGEDVFGRRALVAKTGRVALEPRFVYPAPEEVRVRFEPGDAAAVDAAGRVCEPGLYVSWWWTWEAVRLFDEVRSFQVLFSPHSPAFVSGKVLDAPVALEEDREGFQLRTDLRVRDVPPQGRLLRVRGRGFPIDAVRADVPDGSVSVIEVLQRETFGEPKRPLARPCQGDRFWIERRPRPDLRHAHNWPVGCGERAWQTDELELALPAGVDPAAAPYDAPDRLSDAAGLRLELHVPLKRVREFVPGPLDAVATATWWVCVGAITGGDRERPRLGPLSVPAQTTVVREVELAAPAWLDFGHWPAHLRVPEARAQPSLEDRPDLWERLRAAHGASLGEVRLYAGWPDEEGRCAMDIAWTDQELPGLTFEVYRASETALFAELRLIQQGRSEEPAPGWPAEAFAALSDLPFDVDGMGEDDWPPAAVRALRWSLGTDQLRDVAQAISDVSDELRAWHRAAHRRGDEDRLVAPPPAAFRRVAADLTEPSFSDHLDAGLWRDRYYYRVRAVVAGDPGRGADSRVLGPVFVPRTQPPRAPVIFAVEASAERTLTLEWTVVLDAEQPEQPDGEPPLGLRYEVFRTADRNRACATQLMEPVLRAGESDGRPRFVDSGADGAGLDLATYYYRVAAMIDTVELVSGEDGQRTYAPSRLRSMPSQVVSGKPYASEPPEPPVGLERAVTRDDDGQVVRVRLTWTRTHNDLQASVFRRLAGASKWEPLPPRPRQEELWEAVDLFVDEDLPAGDADLEYLVLTRTRAGRASAETETATVRRGGAQADEEAGEEADE